MACCICDSNLAFLVCLSERFVPVVVILRRNFSGPGYASCWVTRDVVCSRIRENSVRLPERHPKFHESGDSRTYQSAFSLRTHFLTCVHSLPSETRRSLISFRASARVPRPKVFGNLPIGDARNSQVREQKPIVPT